MAAALLIPDDLIQEILLRLPVKSLIRFKSVSKSWRSLISSLSFSTMHGHRTMINPDPGLNSFLSFQLKQNKYKVVRVSMTSYETLSSRRLELERYLLVACCDGMHVVANKIGIQIIRKGEEEFKEVASLTSLLDAKLECCKNLNGFISRKSDWTSVCSIFLKDPLTVEIWDLQDIANKYKSLDETTTRFINTLHVFLFPLSH